MVSKLSIIPAKLIELIWSLRSTVVCVLYATPSVRLTPSKGFSLYYGQSLIVSYVECC